MLSCGTAYRGVDMLPQSPGGPHITRTPTPPWVVGLEEARLENAAASEDIPERPAPSGEAPLAPRKTKRVRVQVDRRIELTDDELKVLQCFCRVHSVSVIHFERKTARAQYVEDQEVLRREIRKKRLEKEGARLISQMLYSVPPICKLGHINYRIFALRVRSESPDPRGLLE